MTERERERERERDKEREGQCWGISYNENKVNKGFTSGKQGRRSKFIREKE